MDAFRHHVKAEARRTTKVYPKSCSCATPPDTPRDDSSGSRIGPPPPPGTRVSQRVSPLSADHRGARPRPPPLRGRSARLGPRRPPPPVRGRTARPPPPPRPDRPPQPLRQRRQHLFLLLVLLRLHRLHLCLHWLLLLDHHHRRQRRLSTTLVASFFLERARRSPLSEPSANPPPCPAPPTVPTSPALSPRLPVGRRPSSDVRDPLTPTVSSTPRLPRNAPLHV